MKLLFDQNLPPKLASFCKVNFADSEHLSDIGLEAAEDLIVWEYAKSNNFTIVTKDSDFNNIVSLFGFPPKIIWIRKGNTTTLQLKTLITDYIDQIRSFVGDNVNGIMTIY
jgi:predicted nuclease of predicted toxin-antitoxin system